jgi:NAD(P)-dependent dehydrogenase (short-subunit alcohol dehydrogenase family)
MAGMLEGKTALITGGGRGIGRATAVLFAKEGARVAVADLSKDGLEETVALINKAGGHATSILADMTKPDDVAAMVTATVNAYGRLDCAFNNAGIAALNVDAGGKKMPEWGDAAFDRMIDVNLKGVWLCMCRELEQMARQGSGAIVNTASIAGLIGIPTSSAYVASKHGVIGLTKTAAIEFAKQGIRVNAVCPGFIETDMTKEVMLRRGPELMQMVPFGRMGRAEEIAEMVCWLCSDRASYVSGSSHVVDGGFTAV